MARLDIITAPDDRLKQVCAPIKRVDAETAKLMDDLLETMYAAPGVGLAAPQVGVPKRILVVDVSREDEERQPYAMANPEIVWADAEVVDYEEGCLSFPSHYAKVKRPGKVRVRYLDRDNETRELEAEGLLATCLQHEMDHLDGILFVDYLSKLKRDLILRKLVKSRRLKAQQAA